MDSRVRVVIAVAFAMLPAFVQACPFCSAVSQTFSEEMESMDVVAVARLVSATAIDSFDANQPGAEVPKSKFEVVEVFKGDKWVRSGQVIETIYFGEAKAKTPFLMMGADAPNIMWSTPLSLSERASNYIKRLKELPKPDTNSQAADDPKNAANWAKRLAFFQEYLEDTDEMLARDAYDEFAKAPYPAVIALKDEMKHAQLLKWIQDPDVPSNRRRLYFTMLGVCGTTGDAPLLESLMRSSDRKNKAGLDAMLACYLILEKQDGLSLVEELFLGNRDAEYADTYAAIMAIRFHGSQIDVIPKTRLVKSLRLMLDRPELADLVIPDLARWEDWEVMPLLVELFKSADESSSWVRVPVINYLRVCPKPEAKKYIEELSKIDADAVKRAQTFFPLGPDSGNQDSQKTETPAAQPSPSSSSQFRPRRTVWPTSYLVAQASDHETDSLSPNAEESKSEADNVSVDARGGAVADASGVPATLSQVELLAESGPSTWLVLGVAMLVGIVLLLLMRVILGLGLRVQGR